MNVGATLAKLAIERAREAGLDHAPTRALIHMALTALDRENKKGDPPDLYFGGRVDLAFALGYGYPDPDTADTAAAHRAVERAMHTIVAVHKLVNAKPARSGFRTEYDLSPLRQPHVKRGPEPHGERPKSHGERGAQAHGERGAIEGPTEEPQDTPMRSGYPQTATAGV